MLMLSHEVPDLTSCSSCSRQHDATMSLFKCLEIFHMQVSNKQLIHIVALTSYFENFNQNLIIHEPVDIWDFLNLVFFEASFSLAMQGQAQIQVQDFTVRTEP